MEPLTSLIMKSQIIRGIMNVLTPIGTSYQLITPYPINTIKSRQLLTPEIT